jgi:hypothetical protein
MRLTHFLVLARRPPYLKRKPTLPTAVSEPQPNDRAERFPLDQPAAVSTALLHPSTRRHVTHPWVAAARTNHRQHRGRLRSRAWLLLRVYARRSSSRDLGSRAATKQAAGQAACGCSLSMIIAEVGAGSSEGNSQYIGARRSMSCMPVRACERRCAASRTCPASATWWSPRTDASCPARL